MTPKPLIWLGSSLDDVRGFPDDARTRAGYELHRVQEGLEPTDWKPLPVIGSGVAEIRVRVRGEHRVLYVAKFAEAIYVLHAFEKKSQKTAQRDIHVAVARWRLLVQSRGREHR